MLVTIPFDGPHSAMAVKLMDWCAEISGKSSHSCLLVVSRDISDEALAQASAAARRAFSNVQIIKPAICDKHSWPETPNLLFRTACRYVGAVAKKPFFWLEVDCVPLRGDWLDLIESEYVAAGRPYMGFRRDIPVPHITGIAVYPPNVAAYNPESLRSKSNSFGGIPFDTVDGHLTVKHAHVTKLIHHEWGERDKPWTFPDRASLDRISKDAVLFHRCKDGSLVDRLRELRPKSNVKKLNVILEGMKKLLKPRFKCYPTMTMVYIHVPGDKKHQDYAREFIRTYTEYKPLYSHKTIVVCQRQEPDAFTKEFAVWLQAPSFYVHDDSGWDIGAFIAVAKQVDTAAMVCFGGSAFFQRAGWMKRMAEAWKKHGPGFYGCTGTFEVSPHLNTSGFWCPPGILTSYPTKVETKPQRYEFEHGGAACWKIAAANGFPAKLVTWDEELDWPDWRKPANIFRRGDQSNCLAGWHHFKKYEAAPDNVKRAMEINSDVITDPAYLALLGKDDGRDIDSRSHQHFLAQHGFK